MMSSGKVGRFDFIQFDLPVFGDGIEQEKEIRKCCNNSYLVNKLDIKKCPTGTTVFVYCEGWKYA